MAVSIDTVYQTVLALANKEQRGYITPQEFNLFANQANKEIFEQYFYDINQAAKTPGNDTVFADIDDMLEGKLQIFELTDDASTVAAYQSSSDPLIKVLPNYIYRVHRVELNQVDCEIQSTSDFNDSRVSSPLLAPTSSRPIANIRNNLLRVAGSGSKLVVPTSVFYFKKPEKVNWTYVVVNKQAMFSNNSTTQNFELHSSEETNLVYKILKLAGVSSKQQDIMAAGQGMEAITKQQQIKS